MSSEQPNNVDESELYRKYAVTKDGEQRTQFRQQGGSSLQQ